MVQFYLDVFAIGEIVCTDPSCTGGCGSSAPSSFVFPLPFPPTNNQRPSCSKIIIFMRMIAIMMVMNVMRMIKRMRILRSD
jgi:hypothetical protein